MKNYIIVGILLLAVWALASAMQQSDEGGADSPSSQGSVMNSESSSVVKTVETIATPSGRTAYIDPKTGKLTSTPPAGLEPSERVTKTDAGEPELIEHPDGMLEVVLNGQLHSNVNAHIDCDGDIEQKHSDHEPMEAAKADCESD